MEPVSYEPGDPIIRRGEPGRRFSVMVSGRAEVRILTQSGAVTSVATMKAGDSFGEMSLLSEDPTSADVVAVERCETLALGRRAFQELIAEYPVLLREFVRLLSHRVKASDVAIGVARQKEEDSPGSSRSRVRAYAVLIGKTNDRRVAELDRGEEPAHPAPSGRKAREAPSRPVHLPVPATPSGRADCGQITEPWGDRSSALRPGPAARPGAQLPALAEGGDPPQERPGDVIVQQRLVSFLRGSLPRFAPRVRVIVTCRAISRGDGRGPVLGELLPSPRRRPRGAAAQEYATSGSPPIS
jgi:CRP-like cAMP-binding protein